MDTSVEKALANGGIIDITTSGAKNGSEHRIEIVFHQLGGVFYITGKPGFKRDWLANMVANPEFVVHLKRGVTADIPARAREITDEDQREQVLYQILTESWDNEPAKAKHILPTWVASAPLVEFTLV